MAGVNYTVVCLLLVALSTINIFLLGLESFNRHSINKHNTLIEKYQAERSEDTQTTTDGIMELQQLLTIFEKVKELSATFQNSTEELKKDGGIFFLEIAAQLNQLKSEFQKVVSDLQISVTEAPRQPPWNERAASLNSTASTGVGEHVSNETEISLHCVTKREKDCNAQLDDINYRNVSKFGSCFTPHLNYEERDGTYLRNHYCTVGVNDDSNAFLLSSTLVYLNGMFSCYCHGIEIASNETSRRVFNCYLYTVKCNAMETISL